MPLYASDFGFSSSGQLPADERRLQNLAPLSQASIDDLNRATDALQRAIHGPARFDRDDLSSLLR